MSLAIDSLPCNTPFCVTPALLLTNHAQLDADYDRDLDTQPSLRHRIDLDIAAELKAMTTTATPRGLHPSVVALGPPPPRLDASSFPLATSSQSRLIDPSLPLDEGLDTHRFTLPPPPHPSTASLQEWKRSLDNASSQLEHQKLRFVNLDLLSQPVGSNSWRLHNFLLEHETNRIIQRVERVKEQVLDVNRLRKSSQLEAGEHLSHLERKWTELISGNLQLEMANVTLEHEVNQLRHRQQEVSNQLTAMD